MLVILKYFFKFHNLTLPNNKAFNGIGEFPLKISAKITNQYVESKKEKFINFEYEKLSYDNFLEAIKKK